MHNKQAEIKKIQSILENMLNIDDVDTIGCIDVDTIGCIVIDTLSINNKNNSINFKQNKTIWFWVRIPVESLLRVIDNQEQIVTKRRKKELLLQASKSVVNMLNRVDRKITQEYLEEILSQYPDNKIRVAQVTEKLIIIFQALLSCLKNSNIIEDANCRNKLCGWIDIKIIDLKLIERQCTPN